MVAVIFLDIDGVICCNMAGRLEESKLAILAEVVKKTQAKVVLSTEIRIATEPEASGWFC